jgi:hypothetical protein
MQHDIPHPKYETTSPKRKRRGIHETGANFKTAGVARADMLLFCRTSHSLRLARSKRNRAATISLPLIFNNQLLSPIPHSSMLLDGDVASGGYWMYNISSKIKGFFSSPTVSW